MNEKTKSILKEHIEYIQFQISNKIEQALKSGALSGDENIHAVMRACTKIATDELVLTKEAKEIYENLKHFI